MIPRIVEKKVHHLLKGFPCVAIIGPRQVGKTTLAKSMLKNYDRAIYLDLELQRDFIKLDDPETYLGQYAENLVVIDEVQRKGELFPVLRGLIDQNRIPGRFLLLGSASPELLRNSSETLAGRIVYLELTPFLIQEVIPTYEQNQLWVKGGFPYPFLHDEFWLEWMNSFIKTYFERDLPNLGFTADSITGERLWTMLAHMHGNLIHYAELGRSLDLSTHTIKKYILFLENAFLIRTLLPYHSNSKKRLVKSPKVYIRDSGLMHYLLGLESYEQILGNPKLGASWEGFVIEQIIPLLPVNYQYYFYRTHDGAELDLVVVKGGRPVTGIEIKFGSDPRPSRGNTEAINTLDLKDSYIIINRKEDYMVSSGFRVVDLITFLNKYLPRVVTPGK